MRIPKLNVKSRLAFAAASAALLVLPACSINVRKDKGGEEKKVDIETPLGGIHVSKSADIRDIGLPVYPGARVKEKGENGEEKSANVNLSALGFGLKVVAVEYESDDPPAKLIAYYKDQLKKYGSVLECHTSGHGGDMNVHTGKHDSHESKELKCEGDNSGKNVELKVGTEDNEHIVSIEPQGKGATFALVYVQTRGKDTI